MQLLRCSESFLFIWHIAVWLLMVLGVCQGVAMQLLIFF